METISFDQGLSTVIRDHAIGGIFSRLALAERAGLSDRAEGWLRQRLESKPGKTIQFGSLGKKSLDDISTFWKALRRGTFKEIAHAARTFTDCGEDEEKESLAFTGLSTPLVLLGRGAVIRALHADLPARLGETFAVGAAVELGDSGDWDNALAILERAHQDGGSPYVHMSTESHLWKHAYLQGHVDTVLPRLAVIPFNRKVPHAAGERAWQLLTYRVRSGRNDVRVPALARHAQTPGYEEAAAMQIAAFESIPSAAEAVAELRRAFAPQEIAIQHADRGLAFDSSSVFDHLRTAQVRVAAQRGNYAKLSRLAEMPSRTFTPISEVVIDALVEEGDWRGAAEFAERYDPRDQPLIEGFDDGRIDEYCRLQLVLAAAAARGGDDAAAHAHLEKHVESLLLILERNRLENENEGFAAEDTDGIPPGLWEATLLAGAAEGLLPRNILAVLLPVFRNPY